MPDANILSDLNSPKARVRDDAIHQVLDRAEGAAAKQLGAKAGRVDFQPGSIAQEVVALHLPRIRETSKDDNDFWRAIFGQVKRAILDRLDKRRVRDRAALGEEIGGGHEAPGAGPGVGTQVADRETVSGSVGAGRAADLAELIREVLPRELDRQICWMYMCEKRRGETVASALDLTVGNVRRRAHGLKRAVAERVLREMQALLSQRESDAARELLVSRRPAADVAKSLGISESQLRKDVAEAVLPAAKTLFGDHGVNFFRACLNKSRAD